jgi:hypothetical protein
MGLKASKAKKKAGVHGATASSTPASSNFLRELEIANARQVATAVDADAKAELDAEEIEIVSAASPGVGIVLPTERLLVDDGAFTGEVEKLMTFRPTLKKTHGDAYIKELIHQIKASKEMMGTMLRRFNVEIRAAGERATAAEALAKAKDAEIAQLVEALEQESAAATAESNESMSELDKARESREALEALAKAKDAEIAQLVEALEQESAAATAESNESMSELDRARESREALEAEVVTLTEKLDKEKYFGRAANEGAAPAGTNPFASSGGSVGSAPARILKKKSQRGIHDSRCWFRFFVGRPGQESAEESETTAQARRFKRRPQRGFRCPERARGFWCPDWHGNNSSRFWGRVSIRRAHSWRVRRGSISFRRRRAEPRARAGRFRRQRRTRAVAVRGGSRAGREPVWCPERVRAVVNSNEHALGRVFVDAHARNQQLGAKRVRTLEPE